MQKADKNKPKRLIAKITKVLPSRRKDLCVDLRVLRFGEFQIEICEIRADIRLNVTNIDLL